MWRNRCVAVVALVVASAALPSAHAASAPCWLPPVAGWVTDPFRPPACPWCAGNRGIEFGTRRNATVRTVAAGTVTFSGTVAGTRYVVVRLANNWLITYGRLASADVRRGDTVARRTVIGRSSGEFFFGVRVGGQYRDPAPYLGSRVGRPRLIPTDGSAPRPAPPARWRCTAPGG